jgi:uncharacterized repeat protein (TIGR01451 family)
MATTDLEMTISDGTTTAVPGTSVSYSVDVGPSRSPDPVTGASVSVPLPTGVTAASWSFAGSLGANTVTGPTSGTGALVTTVDLGVSGVIEFSFTVQVDPSATGTLVASGTITPPAGTTETFPLDNTDTDTDTLTPQADLAVTIDDGTTTVVPGTSTTYTFTVSNSGPSTVDSLTLTDASSPALLSPNFAPSAGAYDTNTGAWSGLSLASGQSVSMTLTGTIDSNATGPITNTATVSPPAGTTDPNPGNNSATDADTIPAVNPSPPTGTAVFLITGEQNPDSSTTFSIYDLGNNSVLAGPYVLGEAPPQVAVEATSYLNGSTLAAMFRIDDGSWTLAYTPIVDNNADNPPTQFGAIGEPWRFEGINARGSEMVWRNASSADLEGYSISNRQIIGADHMGAVGLDWQTVTMGRFGSAPDGLIMQSQSTGVLEVYDIQNNTITGASQLGTVGTDWKFSGLGNFNDDGTTDLLLRNDLTGGLQVYNIKDDKVVGTALLGTIGTDWMYAGVGPIADDSSQNLLLRNTSGDLESYTIKNNAIVDAVMMAGQTDPAQTMVVGLVQAISSNLAENGSSGSMTVAQQPEQQQTMLSQPHA